MPKPPTRPASRNMGRVIPLRLPQSLIHRLDDAAAHTALKRSDIMRMSMERGIDVLLEQLGVADTKAAS